MPMRRCGGPGAHVAATLRCRRLGAVPHAAADVMREALAKGGTPFDSLRRQRQRRAGLLSGRWTLMAAKAKLSVQARVMPGEVGEPPDVLPPAMPAAAPESRAVLTHRDRRQRDVFSRGATQRFDAKTPCRKKP